MFLKWKLSVLLRVGASLHPESLLGQIPAHKIRALAPTRDALNQGPGADSTPHVTSPPAPPPLRNWGVVSQGGRLAIGSGAGPAARGRRKRWRGRGPVGRSRLQLAGACLGVAEGGGPRAEPEGTGVAVACGTPEGGRPGPRSCKLRGPRRHEPLQGVQVSAHGGPAAPP